MTHRLSHAGIDLLDRRGFLGHAASGLGGIALASLLVFTFTTREGVVTVELDTPQLSGNTQFALFFPEKRPFFIENASYFQTPINLFFSRRIADPLAGLQRAARGPGHPHRHAAQRRRATTSRSAQVRPSRNSIRNWARLTPRCNRAGSRRGTPGISIRGPTR